MTDLSAALLELDRLGGGVTLTATRAEVFLLDNRGPRFSWSKTVAKRKSGETYPDLAARTIKKALDSQ